MNTHQLILALGPTLLLLGSLVSASEGEYLDQYSEIRVVGPERKDTGKVVFAAKADREKILSVSVEAFGKKHSLSNEELEQITGFPLSSLTISHEAGYERTGGHMVHFRLKSGEEMALISVTEKKGMSVKRIKPQIEGKDPNR